MKKLFYMILIVGFATSAFAKVERQTDVDGNKAIDVASGGTNATTAAGARSNIGVPPTSCFESESAFNACFALDWQAVNASGFDGNLATTDNTLQEIAQKVDDLDLGIGGATAINDLTDVDTAGKATGRVLKFDAAGNLVVGDDEIGAAGSGDITGITAGTGLTGGGDTGAVTLRLSTTITDAIATIPTISDAAYGSGWNGDTGAASKNAIYDKIEAMGGGVSLSAANTWTAMQTFSSGISASSITSSAADGAHYLDVVNGVAISSTATLGRIAYYNGRMRLADGTDWDGYFLEDTDASANGLSLIGAANYAAMRTLLDLEAGTDFNAYDTDLADLADGSLTASKVAGSSFAPASKATTYTIGTDSANESYGGTIYVTSATTITAPAVVTGMNFALVTIGDIAVSLDVNASDRMILDGVTLSDGDKATNSSKAGDTIVCQYYSADGWYCWSSTVLGGHWTDGN